MSRLRLWVFRPRPRQKNRCGTPSPTSRSSAVQSFGDEIGRVRLKSSDQCACPCLGPSSQNGFVAICPLGRRLAAILSCTTLCAGLVSVNQPEVPPPRRSPNSTEWLQPVEGRGLFRAFRAAGGYELVPIRKYRVRVCATSIITSVLLQLHGCAPPRARAGHA